MHRIYTRAEGRDTIVLYGGSRIEKDHIRAGAYGIADELISRLGVCYTMTYDVGLRESLYHIQRTLFILGAELASDARGLIHPSQTIGEEEITTLERPTDHNMAKGGPLKQLVIPGRNLASTQLHVAHTQSRRLERLLMAMGHVHPLRDALKHYNNRLSDALLSMAHIGETRPDACA